MPHEIKTLSSNILYSNIVKYINRDEGTSLKKPY